MSNQLNLPLGGSYTPQGAISFNPQQEVEPPSVTLQHLMEVKAAILNIQTQVAKVNAEVQALKAAGTNHA